MACNPSRPRQDIPRVQKLGSSTLPTTLGETLVHAPLVVAERACSCWVCLANNSSEPRLGPNKPTNGSIVRTEIFLRDVWCRNTRTLQRKRLRTSWIRSFTSFWFRKTGTRGYWKKGGWIVT